MSNRLGERVRRLAEEMQGTPDDVTAQTALLHRVLVAELMAGSALRALADPRARHRITNPAPDLAQPVPAQFLEGLRVLQALVGETGPAWHRRVDGVLRDARKCPGMGSDAAPWREHLALMLRAVEPVARGLA